MSTNARTVPPAAGHPYPVEDQDTQPSGTPRYEHLRPVSRDLGSERVADSIGRDHRGNADAPAPDGRSADRLERKDPLSGQGPSRTCRIQNAPPHGPS